MPRISGTRVVICVCGRRSNGLVGAGVTCPSCGRQSVIGPRNKPVKWTRANASRAKQAEEQRKEKQRIEQATWREVHREEIRQKGWASYLRRVHGITEEQYEALFVQQNGVCAICKKYPSSGVRLKVDHDHKNELLRGLLCFHCNLILGHAFDSVDILLSAVDYLRPNGQRTLPGSR